MSVPAGRCGFVLDPEDAGVDRNLDDWYAETEAVCCCRESWGASDNGRCRWHARVLSKFGPNSPGPSARQRLDGAFLVDSNLGDIDLSGANLRRADLSEANIRRADLSETVFGSADLSGVALWRADLSGANLENAILSGANLRDADLSRSNIKNANLLRADLRDADLSGANLENANLSGANLQSADFRDAALSGTDLRDADLLKADLSSADLSGTDLQDADLSGTDLQDADLSGTNLSSADLSGSDCAGLEIDDASEVSVSSRTQVSSGVPLRSGFRHRPFGFGTAPYWDARARGYERLRRVFQEKGLDEHHRTLYSYQRRARAKEALRARRPIQWLGNYLSRVLTGHGVRVSHVLFWTAVVLLAPWYWYGLVEGWTGESLRGGPLYYSVVTFVTAPPHPIPAVEGRVDLFPFAVARGSLTRAVALFQTYAGTALIVLLGYVLGNRDPI